MAKKIITESLMAVRHRNRIQRLFESLCNGGFYSTLVALPLLLLQMNGAFSGIPAWWILRICLLPGLLASGWIGWLLPLEAKVAAEPGYFTGQDIL